MISFVSFSIGGGTRGALGALTPTKFVSAHRNLVFNNRKVSLLVNCAPTTLSEFSRPCPSE